MRGTISTGLLLKLAVVLTVTACVAGAIVFIARTAEPRAVAEVGPTVVVTMIDIIPDSFVAGSEERAHRLFTTYVDGVRAGNEPGLMSIDMLQQEEGTNHFVLIEQWKTRADADLHTGLTATKSFRAVLHGLLGGPFDQRFLR